MCCPSPCSPANLPPLLLLPHATSLCLPLLFLQSGSEAGLEATLTLEPGPQAPRRSSVRVGYCREGCPHCVPGLGAPMGHLCAKAPCPQWLLHLLGVMGLLPDSASSLSAVSLLLASVPSSSSLFAVLACLQSSDADDSSLMGCCGIAEILRVADGGDAAPSHTWGKQHVSDAAGYLCSWAGWISQVERLELRFWQPLLHPCKQRQVGVHGELVAQD